MHTPHHGGTGSVGRKINHTDENSPRLTRTMPNRNSLSLADWRNRFAAVREAVRLGQAHALKQARQLHRQMPASLPVEERLALHETLSRAAWGQQAYATMQHHARLLAAEASESNLLTHRITALQLLAQAAYDQGKRSQALRHWLASLEDADNQENLGALCEACLGIGSLLQQDNRDDAASQILQFAFTLAQDAGLRRLQFRSGLLLAAHCSVRQDAAGLARQLDALAGLPQNEIDTAWRVDLDNFHARLHILQREPAAAEPLCLQASRTAHQCRYKWGELQARLQLADIARLRKDTGNAIIIQREALAFAATSNALKRLPLSHLRQLADMQESCGQFAEALASLESWHELHCAAQAERQRQAQRISAHDARLLQLHQQIATLKLERRALLRELQQLKAPAASEVSA
ncbi:hypothetical protein [Chitinilyticum aquatile]|uniref:hypothetical protein n=1 Tax=Chitinilyticum aquatile TaxID=362520 RepID=UPI0004194D28|nr:hypothetical protein [Chitinilyticum aquatile]